MLTYCVFSFKFKFRFVFSHCIVCSVKYVNIRLQQLGGNNLITKAGGAG